jgi:hypothetical protein
MDQHIASAATEANSCKMQQVIFVESTIAAPAGPNSTATGTNHCINGNWEPPLIDSSRDQPLQNCIWGHPLHQLQKGQTMASCVIGSNYCINSNRGQPLQQLLNCNREHSVQQHNTENSEFPKKTMCSILIATGIKCKINRGID